MKKTVLFTILIFSFQLAPAQNLPEFPTRTIKLNIGKSRHGSGDIPGVMVGIEYEKHFLRKLSLSSEIGFTIHDGSDLLLVTQTNGQVLDLSNRYTTAGIQLNEKFGYNFFKTKKYDFGIRLGGLFRYQSSSLEDASTTYSPYLTGLPYPITVNEHTSPQRTYSVGVISQLFASYTINQKIILGVTTGLQLDTNGDTIFPQLSFTIGRRF